MLLFAYVTYFLYSDDNIVNNEEEMAWQYAVINSGFEPGLPKTKHNCFLWNNIFTLIPKYFLRTVVGPKSLSVLLWWFMNSIY